MRQLGFADASLTARGADMGVDVHATGAVAQVKFHGTKTGRPDVQALYGAATAEQATPLFYATGYTLQAITYANATGIALFTYTRTGDITAVTRSAHDLARRSPSTSPKAGYFQRARADRYRQEAERIRSTVASLTARMDKRTQSRSAAKRNAAGQAAEALLLATRSLDSMEFLPPHDRRREDFMKAARDATKMAKTFL